ncbi:MAG: hypothetical protein QOH39_1321 [Verrucomicrobiota bacterium]|jgi:hypothetical protein
MRRRQYTRFLALILLLPSFAARIRAADPAAELASFSIFDGIDLAELAKSDVKTLHGPPSSGRYLSVQSCYVAPGAPARQLEALRQWNPTQHRELKVFLHGDLPSSPTAANLFAKLDRALANGPSQALTEATKKMSRDLQISEAEAKKFKGGSVASFWSDLLAARAKLFVSGGSAAQPPYDHTGNAIRPNEELKALLKQQDKIRQHFSGFLNGTGIGRGPGGINPELYWELMDVDDQGVLTLGAFYKRSDSGQAADVLYYASGGYYVALTLYQMWPVTVEGKASTLVWRGDMISSAALESLHGVERLASESVMVKDIARAITTFRRDSGGR